MKDRAVLLSTLTLIVTVTLFVWLTRLRWGTIGIHPALGWLVLGSALLALTAAGLFFASRRRARRVRQRRPPMPSPAPQAAENAPVRSSPEEPETKTAAVEMK